VGRLFGCRSRASGLQLQGMVWPTGSLLAPQCIFKGGKFTIETCIRFQNSGCRASAAQPPGLVSPTGTLLAAVARRLGVSAADDAAAEGDAANGHIADGAGAADGAAASHAEGDADFSFPAPSTAADRCGNVAGKVLASAALAACAWVGVLC